MATDVFVTKLSSSGNSLIYSTYLGGGKEEYGYGIAVDGSGNAYVTGVTFSSNFPTSESLSDTGSRYDADAFVTKLSSSGNSLIYSTYLGGGSDEVGFGIAVDGSGNAYVTGRDLFTRLPDFESLSRRIRGGSDVFVTKLSGSGNSLIYSTCLGGKNSDYGNGIAIDNGGNAYVTGETYSSDFPTLNPYQPAFQGGWAWYDG